MPLDRRQSIDPITLHPQKIQQLNSEPPMESKKRYAFPGLRGRIIAAPLLALLLLAASLPASAQQSLPMSSQSLSDLDGFRPVAANWAIVGDVMADRNVAREISTSPGVGVLVNRPMEGARDNLFTDWEHGDIELELEFMMPKGSNSGIYLQGRYEIQLFDSWGVTNPTFADAGGIYQRWDETRSESERGYEGHPPSMNVSRAPGLWQTLKIHFQAPRFDADGRKVANARMVKVTQNGVVVHENVELTGPTRASAYQDEVAMGPLMIQGDHGPVALRNIRYKLYQPQPVSLSNVWFRSVEDSLVAMPDMTTITPDKEGAVDGIDWRAAGVQDRFAIQFTGDIHIPYDGMYRFQLMFDWVTGDPHFMNATIGGGELKIDGRTVLVHPSKERTVAGDVQLSAGTYPFALAVFKNRPWVAPRIALYVEGGGSPLQSLNAPGALVEPRYVPAIFVEPTSQPEIIRGFVRHDGVKKTRTIAVGDPDGVHYVMDSAQGAVLHAWKGAFIETTDMWHSRGQDQLAVPRGAVLTFSGAPTVALLSDANAAWPDSVRSAYAFKGYDLGENRHPSFHYELDDIVVSDRISPWNDGLRLVREITLSGDNSSTVWVRIATGSSIRLANNGSYDIDGKTYYLEIMDSGGGEAMLRDTASGEELLIPVSLADGPQAVRYALIW